MTQPSEPQHVDANPTAKRQAHEADTCASAAAVDLVYENEVIDEKDAALLERHRQQKAQLQKLGTGFGLLEEVEGDMDDETTAESAASTSYASALHKPAHIWLNLMSETEPTSLVRCMRDEPLRVGLLPQAVESFGFRPERGDITLKGQRLALDQTPRSLGLADKVHSSAANVAFRPPPPAAERNQFKQCRDSNLFVLYLQLVPLMYQSLLQVPIAPL